MYNVLRAYSMHDAEVGYCQGMGFLVAMFLGYMQEEDAFWMLHACIRGFPGLPDSAMRGLYLPQMSKVHESAGVGDGLLSPGSLLATCLRHHMIAASLTRRGRCATSAARHVTPGMRYQMT